MHSLRAPFAWLFLAGVSAFAQIPVERSLPVSDLLPLTPSAGARRTAQELEQLLAPIALYPDALLALILPASTAPTDIVLAARQIREAGADRSQIEHRAWDESVKSLTYYPDILKWMDENLQWTKQVGEAFAEQPVDVMQAIQRLRTQARAAGTLVDTPQQQVLTDPEAIRIVPAQTNAIYVPYYDPGYVFVDRPVLYDQPFLTFGVGLPVGAWLAFECDWRRHQIWVGNRHRSWTGHDWRRPVVPIPVVAAPYASPREVRPWRPPASPLRFPHAVSYQAANGIVRSPPVAAPLSSGFAPGAAYVRPPGLPVQPRRVVPPQSPQRYDQPTSATGPARPLVTAPNEPRTTPPAVYTRRGPPERQPDQTTPANSPPRHANPPPRSNQPSSAPTASPGPPAYPPRAVPANAPSYSRAAPPAPGGTAPPAPRPQARPQPAPAPAPAAATPPTRTEGDTERSVGRRSPNER